MGKRAPTTATARALNGRHRPEVTQQTRDCESRVRSRCVLISVRQKINPSSGYFYTYVRDFAEDRGFSNAGRGAQL